MVARWLIKVPTVDECIIHLKPVDTPIEDFGHCYGRLYYSLLDNCAKSHLSTMWLCLIYHDILIKLI